MLVHPTDHPPVVGAWVVMMGLGWEVARQAVTVVGVVAVTVAVRVGEAAGWMLQVETKQQQQPSNVPWLVATRDKHAAY